MASFFAAAGTRQDLAAAGCGACKMAGAAQAAGEELTDPISGSEWRSELAEGFQRMETALVEKITQFIAPLTTQVQEIKQAMDQVAQTADAAMELALTNQESSQQQQTQQYWMAEKLMALENQMRLKNLKLRSFPEGSENTELRIFISNWLAMQMQLEDGVASILDAAYRLGPQRRASNALPRDILIRCLDLRTKQKILSLTRSNGPLSYLSYKIQVLQDFSSETLEARRKLRPLTSLLSKRSDFAGKCLLRFKFYTKGPL